MSTPIDLEMLWDAWERVQDNEGCAGCDGITVERYSHDVDRHLKGLFERLDADEYHPYPLLKIVVEKKPGSFEHRTLLVPVVADRVAQTAVAHYLSRSFEEEFLECSYGYRPGRSVDRAVARIRQCRDAGYRVVVDADIRQYFDRIDLTLLLERLGAAGIEPRVMDLLRLWVRASIWDGRHVVPLRIGIPQGSPISPLLANFFLADFDRELEKSGQKLVRYADDFVVLAKTDEEAKQSLSRVGTLLDEAHLSLNTEKTHITSFAEGFHFLGVLFEKEGIWIPWKRDSRKGRILFMARPMPAALRQRYELPRPETVMEQALRKAQHALLPPKSGPIDTRSPEMAFLYLAEQGSVLRKSGDRFLVEKDDEVLLDLPYHKLETILLFGNIQVTTQAMAELLERGIHLSLFSRQGRYRGALTPSQGSNIERRIRQFECFRDSARSLAIARAIVEAKLENGLATLNRYAHRTAASESFVQCRDQITAILPRLSTVANIEQLDGFEGTGARNYFTALMTFNRSEFTWEGRRKHPATDPLNALLSLAYSLLAHELTALLEGFGLDPYLGFLHQPDYGRPSLALDLVETLRHPVADRLY